MILTRYENDCKDNGYNYIYEDECRNNCDNYFKLMDEAGAINKRCFVELLDVILYVGNIEILYEKSTKNVWKSMPIGYFILFKDGQKYEIVKSCDNYYYTAPSGYNYCIDNCKQINLYFYKENKKCEDSCIQFEDPIGNRIFYYIESTNECLKTCFYNLEESFAYPIVNNEPEKCIKKCPKYYESSSNVIPKKECIDTCDISNKVIVAETNECIGDCPVGNRLKDDYFCYPSCNVHNKYIYINTDNYKCSTTCPSYLPKKDLIGSIDDIDVFACKSNCHEDDYRLEDKCMRQCPENFNYIGYNRICNENCNLNPNGEYYYPFDVGPGGYTIYKCVGSCEEAIVIDESITPHNIIETFPYYSKSISKECLTHCPNDFQLSNYSPFYLENKPYECLTKCPDEFPFYKLSANDLEIYICKENTFIGTPKIFFEWIFR